MRFLKPMREKETERKEKGLDDVNMPREMQGKKELPYPIYSNGVALRFFERLRKMATKTKHCFFFFFVFFAWLFTGFV
ncbi:hypothetical protein TIFTF001_008994 [Ficus carica]|uniref:Transmembrane protein n=1 Tax=Ficus carica TaxID=3494 RepID=A0AA88D3A4_FICCA|nr:hypothetical protein TIFTF001_008994 [Ficus carica]